MNFDPDFLGLLVGVQPRDHARRFVVVEDGHLVGVRRRARRRVNAGARVRVRLEATVWG